MATRFLGTLDLEPRGAEVLSFDFLFLGRVDMSLDKALGFRGLRDFLDGLGSSGFEEPCLEPFEEEGESSLLHGSLSWRVEVNLDKIFNGFSISKLKFQKLKHDRGKIVTSKSLQFCSKVSI